MEELITNAEAELFSLQSGVASIETDIETYEKELPTYRQEISLLERETASTMAEIDDMRIRLEGVGDEGMVELRILQAELYALKFHHNCVLREAIHERNRLGKCQDKLIASLERWKAHMVRVPQVQKELIALYKERNRDKEEQVKGWAAKAEDALDAAIEEEEEKEDNKIGEEEGAESTDSESDTP